MITTLNVHHNILKKIDRAARKKGKSRSGMIVILLKKAMEDIKNPGRFGSLVRYQERDRPEVWSSIHVRLRVDDYEYLLDLRRLLKMSVSLLLKCAVLKYMKKLMKFNNSDNNRFFNYVLIKEIFNNVISWRLLWGYPPDIEKILH
jgi:hypothetical protein